MALTLHLNASVDTDLWQAVGPFSDHPVDGEVLPYWDDVPHADIVAGIDGAGTAPTWRQATPLMALPCVDFDGTNDKLKLFANDGTTVKTFGDVVTASASTILIAFYAESITSSANSSNPYGGHGLLVSNDSNFFIGVSHPSGYSVWVMAYSSGVRKSIELAITEAASYVVMMRHESGVMYASVNGGAESSIATGDFDGMAAAVRIGTNWSDAMRYNGCIGEMKIWNTGNADGALASEVSAICTTWLPAAAGQPSAKRMGGVRFAQHEHGRW